MTRIDLDDGKYTVIHNNGTDLHCLRYGEPWREMVGDKLLLVMTQEIEQLRARLSEVHSWICAAPLATPEDLMQNAERVERVCDLTKPYEAP